MIALVAFVSEQRVKHHSDSRQNDDNHPFQMVRTNATSFHSAFGQNRLCLLWRHCQLSTAQLSAHSLINHRRGDVCQVK